MASEKDFHEALRVHGEILRSLQKLTPAARRALVEQLHSSLDEIAGTNGAAIGGNSDEVLGAQHEAKGQRFSDRALAMLEESANGVVAEDIATRLYPNKEPSQAKHNTRAMLHFLLRKGMAHSRGGRWFAGPESRSRSRRVVLAEPSGSRRMVSGSIAQLTLDTVSGSASTMMARAVLDAVRRSNPKVKPVAVYGALHSLAKQGKIRKTMDGNRAVYSAHNGGRGK